MLLCSSSSLEDKKCNLCCNGRVPKLTSSLSSSSTHRSFQSASSTSSLEDLDREGDSCCGDKNSDSDSVSHDGRATNRRKYNTTTNAMSSRNCLRSISVDLWIQYAWILHFVAGAAVLTCSLWTNKRSR